MQFPYAERLMSERDQLTGMAHELAERAAGEGRDLSEAEQAQLSEWQKRCADVDSQLATHNAAIESERRYSELRQAIADRPTSTPHNSTRTPAAPVVRGWGETFVESEQFRSFETGSSGRVEMPGSVLSPYELRQEDVAPVAAPGDPIMTTGLRLHPQRIEPPTPAYRTPLLDVCGRERVSLNQVDWVKWGPQPMNAAGGPIAEGQLKPGADITATVVTVTLETYAHWQAITRQALEDLPRIRSIVEGKLRQGITRKLEEGTGAALVAPASGIPAGPNSSEWLLANIREGMATVETAGYNANAVALNPADWAAFDIGVMSSTLNGPVVGRTFWGLTPVASTAVVSGTAYVGDFRTGVTMFERSGTAVYLTDSHADYMVRNLLLILAEARALPVVTEPIALVKVTGDPNAPTPPPAGGGNGETRRARAAA